MILKLKERNIPVMLFGIPAWSNAGPDYGKKFNAIYPDLALVYQVPLYPFFLEGLIGNRDMMLADGIHPSAAGVRDDKPVEGVPSPRFMTSRPRHSVKRQWADRNITGSLKKFQNSR